MQVLDGIGGVDHPALPRPHSGYLGRTIGTYQFSENKPSSRANSDFIPECVKFSVIK
jgi:hypothetical protein